MLARLNDYLQALSGANPGHVLPESVVLNKISEVYIAHRASPLINVDFRQTCAALQAMYSKILAQELLSRLLVSPGAVLVFLHLNPARVDYFIKAALGAIQI